MSTPSETMDSISWSLDQLHECVPALLGIGGLGGGHAVDVPRATLGAELDGWIHQTAKRLDCEADSFVAKFQGLRGDLKGCFPAVLQAGDHFFAIVRERRGHMQILCPDGAVKDVPTSAVCAEIQRPVEGDRRRKLEDVFDRCGVRGKRRTRAADLLIAQSLGQQSIRHGWVFRESCSAPVSRWFKQVGACRNAALLLGSHSVAYGCWLLSWAVLGSQSLAGHMDRGWLWGWSLLIASFVACRVLGAWYEGQIAIGVGGMLKRRLLEGVLRLDPAEVGHLGVGGFLGQTFEADAVETLALGGGIASVLAIVDLLLSGFVLGPLAVLLTAWFGLAVFLGWRFLRQYERWTTDRLSLTQDLVESMVGHRTRLVQEPVETRHIEEDRALDRYYGLSCRVDRFGPLWIAFIPRGWLLLGLLAAGLSVVQGQSSNAQTAILLGGILLAWAAFERLVSSLSDVAAAYVSWKRIGYLFRAASRPELLGSVASEKVVGGQENGSLLEVDRLRFRHRAAGAAVLDNCSLNVRRGDHILLEGPSGGGKTTLASLLAGARQPESGLILAGGLDRQTLGRDGWRTQVTLVPQFHENHIFTETLAFNLLCGRTWPPTPEDIRAAEDFCRGLGLSSLLDRMPNGLAQMVGDGGWQLSHGERSRVFIARALLQDPSLLILDESFGALDPENLQTALSFTLERARSLMVIAHP